MTTYSVSFKFETGLDVRVEAENEEEAVEKAEELMQNMGVDHLPDMWPEDYEFENVREVQS